MPVHEFEHRLTWRDKLLVAAQSVALVAVLFLLFIILFIAAQ